MGRELESRKEVEREKRVQGKATEIIRGIRAEKE